jgi:hypothetical protein
VLVFLQCLLPKKRYRFHIQKFYGFVVYYNNYEDMPANGCKNHLKIYLIFWASPTPRNLQHWMPRPKYYETYCEF